MYILNDETPCSNIFGISDLMVSFQSSIVMWKL